MSFPRTTLKQFAILTTIQATQPGTIPKIRLAIYEAWGWHTGTESSMQTVIRTMVERGYVEQRMTDAMRYSLTPAGVIEVKRIQALVLKTVPEEGG